MLRAALAVTLLASAAAPAACAGEPEPAGLARGERADRVHAAGVAFAAPGFRVDADDGSSAWLVDDARGLDLHVWTAPAAPGGGDAAREVWLDGLVEEPGFRLVGASDRMTAAGRVLERRYAGRDVDGEAPRSWTTRAALVLAPGRTVELTLLVPPEARAAGEAAFRRVLDTLEVASR